MKAAEYDETMKNTAQALLSLMSEFTFGEFVDALGNDRITRCLVFSNPQGILFAKEKSDGYEITLSFQDDADIDFTVLSSIIDGYADSGNYKKTYVLLNAGNTKLRKRLEAAGFEYWFGTREFEYSGSFQNPGSDIVLTPYDPGHADDFIYLLGKAFEDMRRNSNMKPYDWYEANRDSALGHFEELSAKGCISGWWIDNELAAVVIAEEDYLDTIAVRKDLQGKGLGQRLLSHAMNDILNVGKYPKIRLGLVESNERALHLYTGNGFIQTASMTYLTRLK